MTVVVKMKGGKVFKADTIEYNKNEMDDIKSICIKDDYKTVSIPIIYVKTIMENEEITYGSKRGLRGW